MHFRTKIPFIIIVLCLWSCPLQAQTTKSITVTQDAPFADQLTLSDGSKDTELTVRFAFDEGKNRLTVTLLSNRTPFLFWADTRYKDVISNRWVNSTKFPYVVSSNTADCFRLTKGFHKSLPKPRNKHVFTRWIEAEELQPVSQELKLVNDSVEQSFDLPDRRSDVTVRLRDVMLMDEVRKKDAGRYYEIVCGSDFNTKYRVTIQRNPCLGLDDELVAANGSLEAVRKSYESFKKRYATRKVADETSKEIFSEMKNILTLQFPKNTATSACPDIQQARDQYNQLVDSILGVNVSLEVVAATANTPEAKALNAQTILSNAHLIDRMVARWLVSDDVAERADLVEQCRATIKDTSTLIGDSRGQTPEETHAVDIFRKAAQYFNNVCK